MPRVCAREDAEDGWSERTGSSTICVCIARSCWTSGARSKKAIDGQTYNEMRVKLTEELTLAEMELRDAQAQEIETEAVLDFAQMGLLNASNLLEDRFIRAEAAPIS
jgi:hypothetical protein